MVGQVQGGQQGACRSLRSSTVIQGQGAVNDRWVPFLPSSTLLRPSELTALSLDDLDSEEAAGKPVFAVPLSEAITYASITISTPGPNGDFFVWGVVPTVVARWYVLARFLASARVWLTLSFAALGTMVDPAGGTSKRKLLRSKAHFEFRVAQSE